MAKCLVAKPFILLIGPIPFVLMVLVKVTIINGGRSFEVKAPGNPWKFNTVGYKLQHLLSGLLSVIQKV